MLQMELTPVCHLFCQRNYPILFLHVFWERWSGEMKSSEGISTITRLVMWDDKKIIAKSFLSQDKEKWNQMQNLKKKKTRIKNWLLLLNQIECIHSTSFWSTSVFYSGSHRTEKMRMSSQDPSSRDLTIMTRQSVKGCVHTEKTSGDASSYQIIQCFL